MAVDRLRLARDCLDNRLVGRGGVPMGRVDGIVLAVEPGSAPRVVAIEAGAVVQARRFGSHAERWVRWLVKHCGRMQPAVLRIPWDACAFDYSDCHVDIDAWGAPTRAWERWAARVVARLPGAGS